MPRKRSVALFASVFACALIACSDSDTGSQPAADAGAVADGSAPDAPLTDAALTDAGPAADGALPAAPSPVGVWQMQEVGGYWRTTYIYKLAADGTMAFSYDRSDTNSQFAGCRAVASGTGTWKISATNLDVVLSEGTIERTVIPFSSGCGIGGDKAYPMRAMTANELAGLDFANGRYAIGDGRLTTTTSFSNGSEYPHVWSPVP